VNRLALGPKFNRAQLQPFHENIAGARRYTADIDPVDVDRKKTDQIAKARSGVDRRVHDGIMASIWSVIETMP